jgi:hypothetical protein
MTGEEEEKGGQEEEEENNDILQKEIESWNDHFEYALREEDRILFNQMLSECLSDGQYLNTVNSKGENYSTESLLLKTSKIKKKDM